MAPIDQNIEEAAFIHSIRMLNRAYDQTVEEWLQEYDTGVPVIPAAWSKESVPANTEERPLGVQDVQVHQNACKVNGVLDTKAEPLKLFYDTFRTTKDSRLVIVLTDKKSELEFTVWFNISTLPQRENRKIRTGHMGYFFPEKRSKFRKFWLKYVCPDEKRWGSVYRRLPSRLRKLTFTGSPLLVTDTKGVEYFKVYEISVLPLSANESEVLTH